jgi:hypothetical protein
MHILTANDAIRPQLAKTSIGQDVAKENLFLDIYAGLLNVGHAAGRKPTEQDIGFPLVYMTDSDLAIAQFHDPHKRWDEFSAAVATCSIAGFVDKTDPAIAHILDVHSDLREVTLNPSGKKIFAVVLAGRVKVQNAEFVSVGYHVTVLRRHRPEQTLLTSIHIGSHEWDGSYAHISPILMHGAPQKS